MSKLVKNFTAIAGEIVGLVCGAESAIKELGAKALESLMAYISTAKLGRIDLESWQSGLRPHVVAACKEKYPNANTAKQRTSEIKAAVIAMTNGVKPLAGENLQAFAARARVLNGKAGRTPEVKSRGTKGNTKGKKGKVGNVKTVVTREAALHLLAKGDARRIKVLDFMTTAKWVTMEQCYDDATKAQKA